MRGLFQDIRFGIRLLLRNPGISIAAILCLGLGIGATTAVFSVVDGILLRPFPYRDPDRVVMLQQTLKKANLSGMPFQTWQFLEMKKHCQSFEEMVARAMEGAILREDGVEVERLMGFRVSEDYFRVLGVSPILGRVFLLEECRTRNSDVVIISHALWQRRFGGDPEIVGKTANLNHRPQTIVGVMGEEMRETHSAALSFMRGLNFQQEYDIWMPPSKDIHLDTSDSLIWEVIARLKPDIAPRQAEAVLDLMIPRFDEKRPGFADTEVSIAATPVREYEVGQTRPILLLLSGTAAFVLLIACVNVANLLLSKTLGRQRELALRVALGAGRGRLIRQMLTESGLLAIMGGSVGLLLALWGLDAFVAIAPSTIPRLDQISLNAQVTGFAVSASMLSALAVVLPTAIRSSRINLSGSLKQGGQGMSLGVESRRFIRGLVVVEIAMTLVLLVGAGLLINSFSCFMTADLGFRTKNTLTMKVLTPPTGKGDTQKRDFFRLLLERVETLPGVESAALISGLPLTNDGFSGWWTPDDQASAGQMPMAQTRVITSDYFGLMGIPLAQGRFFSDQDHEQSNPVAIVNETFVRIFYPEETPIGRRGKIAWGPDGSREIVGVVKDVKHGGAGSDVGPEIYVPVLQAPKIRLSPMRLLARTGASPMGYANAIRSEIQSLNKAAKAEEIKTIEQLVGDLAAPRRFSVFLFAVLAASALALALNGLYGVMARSISQRMREFGIRMALGAQPSDIILLVLNEALILVLIGTALGLAGAFALSRVLSSHLYAITSTDPWTYIAVTLLLVAAALLASYIPARRASKVEPMNVLRSE